MSGIVGIINLDGEPIDPSLLGRMTDFMTFRGPDDRQVWIEGNVGFGHTMLRTTWEAEYEQQPFTLDRQVWIVADARIDDRENLAEKLEIPFQPLRGAASPNRVSVVTDVEFILHAYLKWGEACVEHLLGDFAFAIWDGRKQRLFCARDRFGLKLFYYSRLGNCLIFSNTLDCIRQHPLVSSQLNEATIGDFLLFDRNYNLETTAFANIQRLAPAHRLIHTNDTLTTQRYWTLPLPELTRYQNSQDYIDRFHELMEQAVSDRLRIEKVGIGFSGGLDSTTLAAIALDVADKQSQPLDLQAFTVVYDRLMPDEERYYSGIAAKSLAIPIHYLSADDYQLYAEWNLGGCQTPEPYHNPLCGLMLDNLRKVATHSRIVFNGEGSDGGLTVSTVVNLFKHMSPKDLFIDVATCLLEHHLKPPIGSEILYKLRRWSGAESAESYTYPDWLNHSFANRLNLADRWQQIKQQASEICSHPRSNAYQLMSDSLLWSSFLEVYDPGFTHTQLQVRMPYLDLRVLNYLLSLPPLPWCVSKYLLRTAMRNRLPPEIYERPKTPLAKDPYFVIVDKMDRKLDWHKNMLLHLNNFADLDITTAKISPEQSPLKTWENLRVLSLGHWLDRQLNVRDRSQLAR
jgi:asparagine synthase (glutamine-hydrolysing)